MTSFCNVFSINVILNVLQSSSSTIFILTFFSKFLFSNLILVYWDILQESTTHRNFLLGKLLVYNSIILGIKAAWKIKFRFLIWCIFRLRWLFTCYCGRLKFRLILNYFLHFAKSHYFILRFQDNVACSHSLNDFTIFWDSIDFLLFRIFFLPH